MENLEERKKQLKALQNESLGEKIQNTMAKKLTKKQIWKENEQDKMKLIKAQIACQSFIKLLKDI